MLLFSEYLNEELSDISYDEYKLVLETIANDDSLNEDIIPAAVYTTGKLANLYNSAKRELNKIARKVNLGVASIIIAFYDPSIYNIVRAFRFNFSAMFEAVSGASEILRAGLYDVLTDLSNTETIHAIGSGALKIDVLQDKYPILRKLTGPMLAGMMIYMWLSMTFIGSFKYDMNLKNIALAAGGKYTLRDLLSNNDGRSIIVLFGTGSVVSFPWLGAAMINLGMALIYTGLVMLGETDKAQKIRQYISARR